MNGRLPTSELRRLNSRRINEHLAVVGMLEGLGGRMGLGMRSLLKSGFAERRVKWLAWAVLMPVARHRPGSWVIGRLRMERHVEAWVYETQVADHPPDKCEQTVLVRVHQDAERIRALLAADLDAWLAAGGNRYEALVEEGMDLEWAEQRRTDNGVRIPLAEALARRGS